MGIQRYGFQSIEVEHRYVDNKLLVKIFYMRRNRIKILRSMFKYLQLGITKCAVYKKGYLLYDLAFVDPNSFEVLVIGSVRRTALFNVFVAMGRADEICRLVKNDALLDVDAVALFSEISGCDSLRLITVQRRICMGRGIKVYLYQVVR